MKKIVSSFLVLTFIIFQINPIFAAGLVADGTTNTVIDVTSNGTPMVNIAAPNDAGLSHNKYSDFNVDDKNLVMNNSKELTGKSQIGDYVAGNQNLINAGREASAILNEVTSNRASSLAGYTEIYGKKADFILANPNGISVAGAGFINTSRATLVTGTPEITNGMVSGFNMSPTGFITITGRDAGGVKDLGLDLQNVDYASIVSRVITVAGKIYGRTVNLLSGNDKYDYQNDKITSKAGVSNSGGVEFGVDSSVLGGMYAGRINIIATENGFGVRTKGDLVSNVDDILINANGKVEFAKANANRNLKVTANGDITNSEYAQSINDIDLIGKNINSAKLNAGNNINLNSTSNTSYGIAEGKNININSVGNITNTDHTIAVGLMTLTGNSLLSPSAKFLSGDNLIMNFNSDVNYGIAQSNKNVTINTLGNITNTDETKAITGNINLTGNNITSNNLTSGLDTNINAKGIFTNSGIVESYQDTIINSPSVLGLGSYTSHRDINLKTNSLTNNGAFSALRNLDFTILNSLNNYGKIQSGGNLNLNAKDITNYSLGYLYSGGDMNLNTSGNITNYGEMSGLGNINCTTASGALYCLEKSTISANGNISLRGTSLDVKTSAQILAVGDVGINTTGMFLNSGKIEGGSITADSGGEFTNNGEILANSYDFNLKAQSINNNSGALLHSDGKMNLISATNINNDSLMESVGDMDITSYTLKNNSSIYSNVNLSMNVVDWLINNYEIAGYNNVNLKAKEIKNNSSVGILANKNLTLQAVNFYNNKDAYMYSGQDSIYKVSNIFQNDQGLIYGEKSVTIKGVTDENPIVSTVNNIGGDIIASKGNLNIQAGDINNLSIDNYSSFDEPGAYLITATKLEDGNIIYDEITEISEQDRNIWDYEISSNLYAIKQGKMLAGNDINIYATNLTNKSSIITAQNHLNINTDALNNIKIADTITYMDYSYDKWSNKNNGEWQCEFSSNTTNTALLYSNTPAILSGKYLNIFVINNFLHRDDEHPDDHIDEEPSNDITNKPYVKPAINEKVASVQNTGTLNPLDFGMSNNLNSSNIELQPGAGFKISEPNTKYLFVSNNRFLNVYDFTGSDYFIKRLGYDPNKITTKFLGDAIYEQKLVENAIISATRNRYLYDKITNMNDQMTVLYNNAVEENNRLGFEFGKDLSEEQINNLKKDVIWYAEKEVNGYVVLVPIVYLCKDTRKKLDSSSNNRVYARGDIGHKTGDEENRIKENRETMRVKNVYAETNNGMSNIDRNISRDDEVKLDSSSNNRVYERGDVGRKTGDEENRFQENRETMRVKNVYAETSNGMSNIDRNISRDDKVTLEGDTKNISLIKIRDGENGKAKTEIIENEDKDIKLINKLRLESEKPLEVKETNVNSYGDLSIKVKDKDIKTDENKSFEVGVR
jgi:filamentous hemagglutinin